MSLENSFGPDLMISSQEYHQLIAEVEDRDNTIRMLEERHQKLFNQFTKATEEATQLKMQVKDISKQSLRINRSHIAKEAQLKAELGSKEQAVAAAQKELRERVSLLEKEVDQLKQSLGEKQTKIQQQAAKEEAKWKALLEQNEKTHLETVLKLKQEHSTTIKQLNSNIDDLRKALEAEKLKSAGELQAERISSNEIKRQYNNTQIQLSQEKEKAALAIKKLKASLSEQQQKVKALKQDNEKMQIELAKAQSLQENLEQTSNERLRLLQEQRNIYKSQAEGYRATWRQMSQIFHQNEVSLSADQEQVRDTLNLNSSPTSFSSLFSTIHSSNSKTKMQLEVLKEKCKALEKDKEQFTIKLKEMSDCLQRANQSISTIQSSNSSIFVGFDKSFEEELKSTKSLLNAEKEKRRELQRKYDAKKVSQAELKKKNEQLMKECKKFIEKIN